MYFLLSMGIFQPAMLVYRSVFRYFDTFSKVKSSGGIVSRPAIGVLSCGVLAQVWFSGSLEVILSRSSVVVSKTETWAKDPIFYKRVETTK